MPTPSCAPAAHTTPSTAGESEADHAASLALMAQVRYDNAFLFAYSDRGKTYASKHYQDDVPQEVKARRLQVRWRCV